MTKPLSINKDSGDKDLAQELKKANATLRMMESHLVHAGKMAALGQLSAGIVHELRQPLTGIVGYVEDALEEVEKNSSVSESLQIIKKEAARMHLIVDGIRKFSRMSGVEMEPIDINTIINDSLLLLTKQLRNNNIEIETSLQKNLPNVTANASQLQQVFVNMISNAKDALEAKGGGTFTLKSSLVDGDSFVEVTFKDTGCGMPEEVIKKLSEPFFTTKTSDRGTGLGTSISFPIIKKHKGEIHITSKVGSGTTIKLKVPVSK